MTSTIERTERRGTPADRAAHALDRARPVRRGPNGGRIGEPSPYGPRLARRASKRQPDPAPIPPSSTRRQSALSRPHRPAESSPDRDGSFGHGVLAGMGERDQHVYGGTVPWPVVRDRRAANKAARKARRVTRRCGR